eukprot:6191939-Pleurochrysis_carterae.AAC.1
MSGGLASIMTCLSYVGIIKIRIPVTSAVSTRTLAHACMQTHTYAHAHERVHAHALVPCQHSMNRDDGSGRERTSERRLRAGGE